MDRSERLVVKNVVDEHDGFSPPTLGVGELAFGRNRYRLRCTHCPDGEFVEDRVVFDVAIEDPHGLRAIHVRDAFDYQILAFPPPLTDRVYGAVSVTASLDVVVWQVDRRAIDPVRGTVEVRTRAEEPTQVSDTFVAGGLIDVEGYVAMAELLESLGIVGRATGVTVEYSSRYGAVHDALAGMSIIGRREHGRGSRGPLSFSLEGRNRCLSCPPEPLPKRLLETPEPSPALLVMLGLVVLAGRASCSHRARPTDR